MAQQKMTAQDVKDQIQGCSTVSVKGGVYTARKGFYWGASGGQQRFEQSVRQAFPSATIIASGTLDVPFKGGGTGCKAKSLLGPIHPLRPHENHTKENDHHGSEHQ